MKVIGTKDRDRVRRIAEKAMKSSSVDRVMNYVEKVRSAMQPVKVETMGKPTVEDVKFDTVPPVNPKVMPEFYPMYPLMYDVPAMDGPFAEEEKEPEVDYFTPEAMERRALKQRYAESGFRNNAVSGAGAQGAWQIMPITYKDYLGRGRGKAGDLNDPVYNRKVRDWVMKIIPRDLGEFYSESDAPLARLAKIYGAYNWGAGNMRRYLRKQRDAGVDIANDTSWVEGLNPETRRYIKYLAFDEDIPDSTYTNGAFVEAATKRGLLKYGGNLYGDGGPGPGDFMYQPKDSLQLPKEVVPETYLSPYGKFKMNGDGSVYVPGLTNVDSDIRNGNAYYYHDWYPNYLTDPKYTYLKNDETGEYFRYEPELNPNLNLTGYTPVSTKDVKASLPRRDYIGGSDYRLNVVKRVPGLLGMIKQKAAAYGVDPNLMLHRFMREGIVDHWTDQYNNNIDASDQKTFFSDALLHQQLNGYGDVGLDDAGSNLQQGLYSLKDPTATWEPYQTVNEQGRDVTSVIVPDMNSALEIQAADMAYRQRELAKRGLVGNRYVNAAYNMGLYNSKLNDPDFVSGRYSVPDYGVFGEGGNLYGDGGDKKAKKLTKLISKLAEKKTNGLISSNDVETILAHPTDYMKYLYSEDELNEMRRRLYSEYYPMGYLSDEGFPAASDIMLGNESSGSAQMLRNTMSGAIKWNNIGSERLRDSYFAEWLGIPEEERRYPGLLVDSVYRPSIGTFDDLPVYSISSEAYPEKEQQIVDSYYAAKQLVDNPYTPRYAAPEKGNGDNYVVDPHTFLYFNNIPATRKEWRTRTPVYVEKKASDTVANGLSSFTVGSGIDPNRGQYISMFDKWDVNPFDNGAIYQGGLIGRIAKTAGIPQNFDATGGVGKPFYLYDRVYLDNYYGVDSRPKNPDEYYGGYIMPSVATANVKASGGKIHIKPENRGKFTALKKRTGHSASWFKAHGTPAQKKMAVFELNSRHWGNRKDEGGENLIAEYPEGYNGEIRQGKSFNAWDRYLANHPMVGHRLRKAKTLLLDAARVHPLTSFATDVYDSYAGPQDESDKITTPLGVVGRGGDIILNTVKQAGEIEPNMKKVFGRSAFGRLVSLPDFIDDSLKFVRDFAEPVTSFENGGYLLGHVYDLSEEQVSELIRQGYEVERV